METVMVTNRLLSILTSLSLLQFSSQTCYWPNGAEANPDFWKPCFNNDVGTCCYSHGPTDVDLCYTNGMCYSLYFGRKYRGACTLQTWSNTSGCATECLDFGPDNRAIITDCKDDNICCGQVEDALLCCQNKAGFQWDKAAFITTKFENAEPSNVLVSTTTVTQLVSETNPVESFQSGDTKAAQSGAPGDFDVSPCKTIEVALGFGLGLPLLLALAIAILLGILLRRFRKQDRSAPVERGKIPPPLMYSRPIDSNNVLAELRARQSPRYELNSTERHELS